MVCDHKGSRLSERSKGRMRKREGRGGKRRREGERGKERTNMKQNWGLSCNVEDTESPAIIRHNDVKDKGLSHEPVLRLPKRKQGGWDLLISVTFVPTRIVSACLGELLWVQSKSLALDGQHGVQIVARNRGS